jgi:hypothetical protein
MLFYYKRIKGRERKRERKGERERGIEGSRSYMVYVMMKMWRPPFSLGG